MAQVVYLTFASIGTYKQSIIYHLRNFSSVFYERKENKDNMHNFRYQM